MQGDNVMELVTLASTLCQSFTATANSNATGSIYIDYYVDRLRNNME